MIEIITFGETKSKLLLALSVLEGLALSAVEGLALSAVEGLVLSAVEGSRSFIPNLCALGGSVPARRGGQLPSGAATNRNARNPNALNKIPNSNRDYLHTMSLLP